MTTQAWTTRLRHDSDATFREWGLEFSTKLAAVGLTQTADTGQVNWATVTRPGANTEGGFEMWRFNDTAHSTTPIFIRFGYGTAAGTTTPRIQVTVGSGSNGSGTITGTAPFTVNTLGSPGARADDTTYNSYMCYLAAIGAFGVFYKSASNCSVTLLITRDVDASGVGDTQGCCVIINATSFLTAACMRLTAGTITTKHTSVANAQLCLDPYTPGASAVGADFQAYLGFGCFPRVKPVLGYVGVRHTEFPEATTFTFQPVGSTNRTYIAGPNQANFSSTSALKAAMIWE